MLSKKTKYALSALLHLAKNQGSDPISAAIIAEKENIPLKFLEAILTDLKKAKLIKSKKGKAGGFWLHKTPAEINMAMVMRLFDGPIAILPCATHEYYEKCAECINEDLCGIRKVAIQIRNETVAALKTATLERLILLETQPIF